ncbi:MAG: hypothetical protein KGS61_03835 [Verrucomicrobia bacterium]|nr:hypothetical protein [Verrucomicrobiota bacterium]
MGELATANVVVRSTESGPPANDAADPVIVRLTRGVAAGDEVAFREFFDRYRDRLFRFLIVLTRGDELTANELVQSVMLTAAAKLRPVRTEAHVWNWLARVARQLIAK